MDGIGKVLDHLVGFCMFSFFVLLPLGAWKAFDIIVWIFKHIHWE